MTETEQFINTYVAYFPKATAVLAAKSRFGCEIFVPVSIDGDEQKLKDAKEQLQRCVDNDDKEWLKSQKPDPDDPPPPATG